MLTVTENGKTISIKQPMLASDLVLQILEDFFKSGGTLLMSPKLDGIRGVIMDRVLVGRSLKPLPNLELQARYCSTDLYHRKDGELVAGSPCEGDVMNRTTRVVMKAAADASDVHLWVFDNFGPGTYDERSKKLFETAHMTILSQTRVDSMDMMLHLESEYLAKGYEGGMIRRLDAPYRSGKSQAAAVAQHLMKVKRSTDDEGLLLEVLEAQENTNEAFINEVGKTARSSAKAGKVGKGMAGAFMLRDFKGPDGTARTFKVAAGKFTHAEREQIWHDRANLEGKVFIKYRYFGYGELNLPRHGRALGFRDPIDM